MTRILSCLFNGYGHSYHGIPTSCWRRIALSFLRSLTIGVIGFLAIYFVRDLSMTESQMGLIIAAYGLGMTVGAVAGGKCSDKLRPSIVAIISLIVMGASFLLLASLKTFSPLLVCLFLIGLSSYSFLTANTLWILNYCRDDAIKQRSLSVSYAASNLGVAVSSLIVSGVAKFGFIYLFWGCAAILFLSALYLWVQSLSAKQHVYIKPQKPSAKLIATRNKIILVTLVCVFLGGVIIAQQNATYPIYIESKFHYLGIKSVGVLFALNAILIVIFQAPLTHWLNKANKLILIGVGIFLMGLGMCLLIFAFTYSIAIIACIVYTVGEMLFFPIAQLVCYQGAHADHKGHSLGVLGSIYAISRIIGPAAGGVIYEQTGGNFLWSFMTIIGIIALILCLSSKSFYNTTITK